VFTHLLFHNSKSLFHTSYIFIYIDCGSDADRSMCQQETYPDAKILEISFHSGGLNKQQRFIQRTRENNIIFIYQ
jgi:hypothetical protein